MEGTQPEVTTDIRDGDHLTRKNGPEDATSETRCVYGHREEPWMEVG